MTKKSVNIKDLLKSLEKKFGKGAVMTMSESGSQEIKTFSTGSIGLDAALGVGGLPYGRVMEVYGPESSGKTTLALHCIQQVQAQGGIAAFIDAEHALDVHYAEALGVDLSRLLVSQPDSGEQALEIADSLTRSGEVGIIVIDSVAALTPRAEIQGEMGAPHMGLQARLMSQALRKLAAAANQSGTAVFFINQLRQKIGVVFGSNETTTGGNALKFYASVRVDIRRIGILKDKEQGAIGNRVRVKVVKNKVAPPFRLAEFEIYYGKGICRMGELIDLGLETEVIEKAGSWLSMAGESLGQGREQLRARLLHDNALVQRLSDAVGLESNPTPMEKAA